MKKKHEKEKHKLRGLQGEAFSTNLCNFKRAYTWIDDFCNDGAAPHVIFCAFLDIIIVTEYSFHGSTWSRWVGMYGWAVDAVDATDVVLGHNSFIPLLVKFSVGS